MEKMRHEFAWLKSHIERLERLRSRSWPQIQLLLGQGEYGRSLLRATESFMICCVFVNVQLHEYRVRVVVGTLP
jgi:hypothetical protein